MKIRKKNKIERNESKDDQCEDDNADGKKDDKADDEKTAKAMNLTKQKKCSTLVDTIIQNLYD